MSYFPESPYPGVYWNKKQNCWVARIYILGRNHLLGTYINENDAIAARKKAEVNIDKSKRFFKRYPSYKPYVKPFDPFKLISSEKLFDNWQSILKYMKEKVINKIEEEEAFNLLLEDTRRMTRLQYEREKVS